MHRLGLYLLVVIISLSAAVVQATPPSEASLQVEARQALQDSFPGAQIRAAGDLVQSVYGRGMDTGETPEASAERFRSLRASVFGVSPGELRNGLARRDGRRSQPVSYNAATGQYKFTLFYYSQFRDEIPVFRAELRVLVRNDAPHPVVLANSSLRPLGAFDAAGRVRQANAQGAIEAVQTDAPNLDRVTNRGLVIWAGVNEQLAVPTASTV